MRTINLELFIIALKELQLPDPEYEGQEADVIVEDYEYRMLIYSNRRSGYCNDYHIVTLVVVRYGKDLVWDIKI